MKRSKMSYLMIVILLLLGGTASADIEISQSSIELNLVGGDTVTEGIIITWTGETVIVGFIETDIIPDEEGINVAYSENPVILYPNVPRVVNMTIATAINIVPDNYVIITQVFTDIEKVIEYRDGGTRIVYKTVKVEDVIRINELLETIQQLRDEISMVEGNCTEQVELLADIIASLDVIIDDLKEELEHEYEPDETEEENNLLIVLLLIIFCLIIVSLCLHYKFRVLKFKDKGEKNEEHK